MSKNALTISQMPFSAYISSPKVQQSISNTLGDATKTKKFTASIISAVTSNPTLKECVPSTIVSAALVGEALNLPPSPQLGRYYIVPYANKNNPIILDSNGQPVLDNYGKEKRAKDGQFILGYKGYIELALRSGQYEDIDAKEVREGEYKGLDDLGRPVIEFIQDDEERLDKPVVGYMAYLILTSGFKKKIYWSKTKMKLHANKYSSAFDLEAYNKIQAGTMSQKDMWKYSSYWYADFDGMAFKTMLRQLISKWGVLSVEMQTAFTKDMAVIDEDGNANYVDNPQNEYGDVQVDEQQEAEIVDQKSSFVVEEYKNMSKIKNLTKDEEDQVLANNKILSYQSCLQLVNHPTAGEKVMDVLEKGYHNCDEFDLKEIADIVFPRNN